MLIEREHQRDSDHARQEQVSELRPEVSRQVVLQAPENERDAGREHNANSHAATRNKQRTVSSAPSARVGRREAQVNPWRRVRHGSSTERRKASM